MVLSCDNSFFSQRAHPLLKEGTAYSHSFLEKLPAQAVPPVFSEKTGLGSSAALIVSLVGALFDAFAISAEREELHFVSQIANSLAQKKVGSGFDVAAAVFGSLFF